MDMKHEAQVIYFCAFKLTWHTCIIVAWQYEDNIIRSCENDMLAQVNV